MFSATGDATTHSLLCQSPSDWSTAIWLLYLSIFLLEFSASPLKCKVLQLWLGLCLLIYVYCLEWIGTSTQCPLQMAGTLASFLPIGDNVTATWYLPAQQHDLLTFYCQRWQESWGQQVAGALDNLLELVAFVKPFAPVKNFLANNSLSQQARVCYH